MAVIPSSLGAQTARDREQLAGFVDSLASASDNEGIRAIERSLMVRARRERSNPALHMRLGLIALRLGEYPGAASEFKWVTQLAPQWGSAWLGWGQAELGIGEVADTTRIGRRAFQARDAFERATQAFARAVAIDTALGPAIELIAFERADSDRMASAEVVRQAFRRVGQSRTRPVSAALSLGRIEALLGDTTAALAAFDAAAAAGPSWRGQALLAAARIRLPRGDDSGGARAYYQAAAIDDPEVVAQLRGDVASIATAAELEAFTQVRGAERVAWLRRFWTRRDRADLRATGHRPSEHYRRLAHVSRLFPNPDDQRVTVWVRHGEPDGRATLRLPQLRPSESWRYRRQDGDLLVHFVAGADTTNYRIVESVFDVVTDHGGVPAGGDGELAGGLVDQVLRSRAQLSPFYQAAVAGNRDQLAAFRLRERELSQAGRNLALTTDGDPLRFARELPSRIQIASLEGDPARGFVRVLFLIPRFVLDSAGGALGDVTARVRMVVWDSAGEQPTAVDTVVPLTPPSGAGPRDALRGQAAVPVPAGRYSVRAAIEIGDRGVMAGRENVQVGGGRGPALADLAIGTTSPDFEFTIAEPRPISSDPGCAFEQRDSIVVSAAWIGSVDREARFRVMVRPIRADGKEEKWRSWPKTKDWRPIEVDSGGRGRATAVLPARGLKPGRYEVELIAVDGQERTARAQGRIAITGSGG